ncbi:MAG: S41 family peptidase [Arhodomonas sp.]|nr:S41 family peptidase [Arhodomonas sp.]
MIDVPAFYMDFEAAEAGEEDYRSTSRDVERLISEIRDEVDGIILDLRGNAGGSLEEATRVAGLFIEHGPIVQVQRSTGEREVLEDDDGGAIAYRGPLGVMVDSYSASASEIVAAAIQDYDRGVVVGDAHLRQGYRADHGQPGALRPR